MAGVPLQLEDEVDLAQLRMANNYSGEIDVGGDSSPYGASTSGLNRRSSKIFKDNECITCIEPIILQQKWTISNFATLLKLSPPGSCLRSTVFRDVAQPEACWQLCLYPGGKREENVNHVSLFLKMSATTPNKEVCVKAEYRFHFLDEADKPRFSNVNIGDFHAKPPKGGHSWGLRNIPRQKVMNCIRSDNSLVIQCVIELIPHGDRVQCKRVGANTSPIAEMACVPRCHIVNELQLLKTGYNSDFEIIAGEEKIAIPVHKFKLVAHSDVFKAMLEHCEMDEAKYGKITIPDFNVRAIEAMMEFIYAGTISSEEMSIEELVELMQLADKYNIMALKSLSECELISKVTPKNVVDCLLHADRFNASALFERCLNVMVVHKTMVLESSPWQDLKNHSPRLCNVVLEQLIQAEQVTPPIKRSRI